MQTIFETWSSIRSFPNCSNSPHTGDRMISHNMAINTDANAFHAYSFQTVKESDSGRLIEEFLTLNMPRLFLYCEANRSLTYLDRLRAVLWRFWKSREAGISFSTTIHQRRLAQSAVLCIGIQRDSLSIPSRKQHAREDHARHADRHSLRSPLLRRDGQSGGEAKRFCEGCDPRLG
jgi:hypothetical protein